MFSRKITVVYSLTTETMKTPIDQILPTLATWELADLRNLQAALGGLIEALESSETMATSQEERLELSLPEQTSPKTTRGHIEVKYIPRGNKRHGPYLYLRYWQDGRLRSKYLGKPKQ